MSGMNLSKKLLFGGALLTLIPLLILGAYTILNTTSTLTELSESTTLQTADKLCSIVNTIIDQEIVLAKGISGLPEVARVIVQG
jgi:hypothetical protein